MGKRRTTAEIMADPNPRDVMRVELEWRRERYGVDFAGVDQRAEQLVKLPSRPPAVSAPGTDKPPRR